MSGENQDLSKTGGAAVPVDSLYSTGSGTVPTTAVATLTDTLTFTGGTVAFDEIELTSTDNGVLLNRVTTAQMNGIASPTTNEIVYNTDLNGLYRYDGAAWVGLSAGYGIISVNDSSGMPTYYATLKAAVDAIGGNGVVNIHSDITLTSSADEITSFSSFDTLTINGNGYTITHTSNTGDEFSILNSTASSSNPTALYLNNIKIISNGITL